MSPLLGRRSNTPKDDSPKKKSNDLEYVMINIVATEAARKASKEQNEYRISKHAVSAH